MTEYSGPTDTEKEIFLKFSASEISQLLFNI